MTQQLDIRDIMDMLPHRYPFLLIDRVVELDAEAGRVVALKNVTVNEPQFTGHFPNVPVMPGVLIIEAMAQTGVILVAHSFPEFKEHPDQIYLFTGIEKARFRSPVRPGDKLVMECTNLTHRMQLWKMDTKAYVDGNVVAEAGLTASVLPRESF